MSNSFPFPSEQIFPDENYRIIAIQTVTELISIHELILEGSVSFNQEVTKALIVNPDDLMRFFALLNEQLIPTRFVENIEKATQIADDFTNKARNGEINRYAFDLLVMDLYCVAIDVINLTIESLDFASNNFAIEIDSHLSESDRKDFAEILTSYKDLAQTVVKNYSLIP